MLLDEKLFEDFRLDELLGESDFEDPSRINIKAQGPYNTKRINTYLKNIINSCTFKPEILVDSEENEITITVPGRQD